MEWHAAPGGPGSMAAQGQGPPRHGKVWSWYDMGALGPSDPEHWSNSHAAQLTNNPNSKPASFKYIDSQRTFEVLMAVGRNYNELVKQNC